jgi:hypothetical protein
VSASQLIVVSFGDAPSDATLAMLGVRDVVLARDAASPAALLAAAGAAERHVLWLPAWADVSPALATAIGDWRARDAAGPRVVRVHVRLSCGARTEIGAPVRVLLSSPGAATLLGEEPRALASARVDEVAATLAVRLPEDLTEHLAGVNEQSSIAARLRHAAGREAAWADLAWRPALLALRALASATGTRRDALPHAVIEAYREVLSTAKLWELAHGTALA